MNATTRRFVLAAFTACAGLALPLLAAGDFPKGSPNFEKSYRAAEEEAKKTGKPMIVIFSAHWCGPCQAMKNSVYPSDAVKPFHDKFVWAYLDVDDKGNDKAKKEFNVSSIPHIQFLDSNGKPLDKQIGSNEPAEFAKKLKSIAGQAGDASARTGEKKAGA